MTLRYTANTNFRSQKPKNGLTRFLAEPGFDEAWLTKYVRGRIKGHKSRWEAHEGDLIRLNVRFNRNEDVKFYGIIIQVKESFGFYRLRFYNTKEEAVNQRILRDLQSPEDWFTYVMKLNMADFRPKADPQMRPMSLL